ncbi:MAG: S8 family serine peptidase [Bacteroidota bacterium]
MKKLFRTALFLSIVIIAPAQQLIVRTDGVSTMIPAQTGAASAVIVNNAVMADSSETQLRVIVELNSPSRLKQRRLKGMYSTAASVLTKQALVATVRSARIEKEFETVFSGFSVTVDKGDIHVISSLPGVKNIYPDLRINATPVSMNNAPADQTHTTSTAASAQGIRIGIIDTGIDYLHESLGGGYGEGFQVAGGYDFVNNDPDPMDDNGHGTHVAGIIGGNSSAISGLAKDAQLFAYKVLDKNGGGYSSTVLAALERAVQDSMQVLNLSLGTSYGHPDDPLATAVDALVEAGIIVVVSAGNAGEFGSIHSPGVSRQALTVGASNGNTIASFSSKGPVAEGYMVKPNVVAPGVGILSAKNGGGYVQMSGTSMAAPFVTAVAATLRAKHPDWSATEIIAAIISNSTNLHTGLFAQGNGRVDETVLETRNFALPAHLSFGFDSLSATTWSRREKIRIISNTSAATSYRLVSASVNPAIQIRCTPQQITVGPQQPATVDIDLTANNLFLSNNKDFAGGYTGTILAIGENDTIVVPYTFFKGHVVSIQFSEIPRMVLIHNQKNFSKVTLPKSNYLSLVVEEGMYDIVSTYIGSRYHIRENVGVSGKVNIDIESSESRIPLTFQPVDETGAPLAAGGTGTFSSLEVLVHRPTGFALIAMGGGKSGGYIGGEKYFSKFSDNYLFAQSLNIQPDNFTSYTYDMSIDSGITDETPMDFTPSSLQSVEIKYRIPENTPRAFPITWTSYINKSSVTSVTFFDGTAEPLQYPFTQRSLYTPRSASFPIFHQREAYRY